jgi:hypothetical protein
METYLTMVGLRHTSLDLADVSGSQLRAWKNLREYFVLHRAPLLHGLAQWSLLISMVIAFGALLTVVLQVLIINIDAIKEFSTVALLSEALIFLSVTVAMLQLAVKIWSLDSGQPRRRPGRGMYVTV